MLKKKQVTVAKSEAKAKTNGNRTPEGLRKTLQEFDIETTADSQAKAIGAIYRAATHEPEINYRLLLSAIGRVQNLHSLTIRAATLASKKGINSQFFLTA